MSLERRESVLGWCFAVKSTILDQEDVRWVVNSLLEADEAVDDVADLGAGNWSALRIVDAFFVPKLCYDPIKKVFYEYGLLKFLEFRLSFGLI